MNKFQPIIEQADKLREQHQYLEAIELYSGIENETKLSPDQQSHLLLSAAHCYAHANNYAKAKEYYEAALKRAELRERIPDQRNILHSLALLEKKFKHYDAAITLFRQELSKICSNFDNFFALLSENYYQQGLLMMIKEDMLDCRMYLNHAITYAGTTNHNAKGHALAALGRLNLQQNKRKDALKCFRMAYENYKVGGHQKGIDEVLELIHEYEKQFNSKKQNRYSQKR